MPKQKLVKTLGNIGLDFAVGSVPLPRPRPLGDTCDFRIKANRRHLEVTFNHFGEDGSAKSTTAIRRR